VPAVVVLGSSLAGTRRRLVAAAERAVRELHAELVVLSGWAPGGGRSEAQQMRDLWRESSDLEFVLEETASTTAENAARTAPLLTQRHMTEAVVICTPLHLLRARWIFRRIYGDAGITVAFRLAREAPTPGALLWELAAFTISGRQVRAASAKHRRP
jgi:uncharacterized SAM-binding protein YcdF (DUF218 family)